MEESKKPNNPNVFPQTSFSFERGFEGMTLRDYFAAKAMQGMVSNGIKIDIDKDYPFQTRAETAYLIADAMLKQREK